MTSLVHSGANILKGVHMLTKVRDNIYLSDGKTTAAQFVEAGVTVVHIVDADVSMPQAVDLIYFETFLETEKVNKPHVKDVICHIPKYMTQNGEVVAVVDKTGLKQATYVVARAICELEAKSIYEIFVELEPLLPGFDINKAYL